MPLAKYITAHLETPPAEAMEMVKDGYYKPDELESLAKHENRIAVLEVIKAKIPSKMVMTKADPAKCNTMLHLDLVAEQINTDFADYKEREREATKFMLKIGLMIEHAKEQLPHGQLNKWIESNTTISRMHAHRFRKLAQVFIETQKLKAGEAFALVDPENSKEALADKLQQMAFDFLGDKTQADLFAEHGIAVKQAKALGGARDKKPQPLTPEQVQEFAEQDVLSLITDIQTLCIGEDRKIQMMEVPTLRLLEGDLIDALKNVRQLIKAG